MTGGMRGGEGDSGRRIRRPEARLCAKRSQVQGLGHTRDGGELWVRFFLKGACGNGPLADYGFRAVIAPSFADIFYNNCFKNGVLPVTLERGEVSGMLKFGGRHRGRPRGRGGKDVQPGGFPPARPAWPRFEIEPPQADDPLGGARRDCTDIKVRKGDIRV